MKRRIPAVDLLTSPAIHFLESPLRSNIQKQNKNTMNKSIIVVLSCLAVAIAQENVDTTEMPTEMPVEMTEASVVDIPNNVQTARPYHFFYKVKDDESKNDYYHLEKFDGVVTRGEYSVQLPDGRLQTVTYRVDANGYVADVKYEGEARHPELRRPSRIPV